ncbi:charged multivesicular body protein 4b-like [Haliotis cracherodii]|uniref:charged multivesicular body protein 4b-like n=1 Tax=Haliotis cracherodii TaxID=6455 RepID=UPI0039ED5CAA
MSLFGIKLFGSKKTPPTPAEAIQRLRDVEEMLMKKSDFLEKKVEAELQTAKKNGTKNKRVALMALKRKKRYEKQLTQIDGTLSTIEFQREALENASTNSEVLKVMGTAAKALKGAHDNMDIDQVHNLMDDVAEQQEIANEISEAISNPTGLGEDFDEDDLLSELNELEEEELNRQLLDVNVDVPQDLPSVPTSEPEAAAASSSRPRPVAAKADDDDDMRELEMWAS